MRRFLSFTCLGATLAATLDEAPGNTGLLILSGGNEIRIGAHRGMAKLARDVAAAGFPVFRFDRRGIGDSGGENGGFKSSAPDIKAALEAFRAACPHMTQIIAFGNCDAATALRLHLTAEVAGLVLANPWIIEDNAAEPPPATSRAYYARRLRDPKAWLGLLRGAVRLDKLLSSLKSAARPTTASSLAEDLAAAMTCSPIPTRIILCAHDGTAVAFKAQWDSPLFAKLRDEMTPNVLNSDSHSFAPEGDYATLRQTLLEALGDA